MKPILVFAFLVLSISVLAQEKPLYLLPSGPEGPGKFGAYYTHLEFDPEWDKEWRVGDHPDIVVRFEDGGHRLVFWRGTSYIPCWVTDNGIWYTNEFVERRNIHSPNTTSIVEPMSDKQCRYSQVRIIESNPARVVIHWRYAPVDVDYEHPFIDQETGWFDWVDEYYTIYPNGSGVRAITVQSNGLHKWIEFQESIVVNQPGTLPQDNIEEGAVSVSNMDGEHVTYFWNEDGGPEFDRNPPLANILKINLKSERQPYALVAPPKQYNNLITSYLGHGRRSNFNWWDHWPVSQDASDGRGARSSLRPSHSSLCHIALPKDPPVDCWGSYGYSNVIKHQALEWTLTEWGGLNIDMGKEVSVDKPITISFDYADLWTRELSMELYGPKVGEMETPSLQTDQLILNSPDWNRFEQTLDPTDYGEEEAMITEFYLEITGSEEGKTVRLDNLQLRFADGEPIYLQEFDHPDGTTIETIDLPNKAQWEPYLEEENKITRLMLHGMTDKEVQELVPLAKSWTNPPVLIINGSFFESQGYDPTQMAYLIDSKSDNYTNSLSITLQAKQEAPLVSPAFVIKGWGNRGVELAINGELMEEGIDYQYGFESSLESEDLILWMNYQADSKTTLVIRAQKDR